MSAFKGRVVTRILHVDKTTQRLAVIKGLADLKIERQVLIILRRTQTVDTAHARDDNHVVATQKRTRRR